MFVQGAAAYPENEDQQQRLREAAEGLRVATNAAAQNAIKKKLIHRLEVRMCIILPPPVQRPLSVWSCFVTHGLNTINYSGVENADKSKNGLRALAQNEPSVIIYSTNAQVLSSQGNLGYFYIVFSFFFF